MNISNIHKTKHQFQNQNLFSFKFQKLNSFFWVLFIIICDIFLINSSVSINQIRANETTQYSEPINIEIINTKYDEFAPNILPDLINSINSNNAANQKLIFNSNREKNTYFYTSEIKTNTQDTLSFDVPLFFNSDFNIKKTSQSYISFERYNNSNRAYISKFTKYNGKYVLNIYYTIFKKQSWSEGIEIEVLKLPVFSSHPTISAGGDYIIFTSVANLSSYISNSNDKNKNDDSKGYEKSTETKDTDLYIIYKDSEGNWSPPEPLEELNTNYSEITPYLAGSDGNDTLYFASNGYGGPGGYDIYYSVRKNGVFERPNPMHEINTEFNESDICVYNNLLYFASDRPGGKGGLDLYYSIIKDIKTDTPNTSKALEIALNPFLSSIKVKRNYTYTNMPLGRYIPVFTNQINIDENATETTSKFATSTNKKIEQFLNENIAISNQNIKLDNTLYANDYLYHSFINPILKLYKLNIENQNLESKNIESKDDEIETKYSDIKQVQLYITVISKIDNLKINSDNYLNEIINQIKDYFHNNNLITKDNIQTNYVFNKNLTDNEAYIYYDYSNLDFMNTNGSNNTIQNNLEKLNFEKLKFEILTDTDSIVVEPSNVGFEFYARPVSELKSWATYLLLKDKITLYNSNNSPIQFQVDLNKYKSNLINLDSLVFYTTAQNHSNTETNDYTTLNIIHTKFKSQKTTNINNNFYISNSFTLPFFDELLLKKDIILNKTLRNFEFNKKEVLINFSDDFQQTNNKSIFLNYLKSNYSNLNYKIIDNKSIDSKSIKENNKNNDTEFKNTITFYTIE